MSVSYKVKYTRQPSDLCSPGYLPKQNENLCLRTHLFSIHLTLSLGLWPILLLSLGAPSVTLFVIPPTCKQFNCPEWINILCFIHTMGYYAAIQRNKLTIQAKTWINLKSILLNEKKLNPKTSYGVISIIWHSEKGKIISSRK